VPSVIAWHEWEADVSTTLAFDLIARDRSASKTFDKVGDSADRSHKRMVAWAKVGAVAVVAGAALAGKALFDMAKGAAADEAGQKRLAVAMKNGAGATKGQVAAVESWITAQGKALGVADDDLRPALGKLVAATHDVGKSQKLAALAMDVSAGSGKSLDAVSTALAKAQNGNVGGLSRLGVATKDAAGHTRSLTDITKDLAKTYSGQASAAAETTEGKWKRVKLRFDEAKESIGAKLLPIGAKLADFMLNDLGPAAQKVGDWFKEKVVPPLRDFGERMAPKVHDVMVKVRGAFRDAQPYFEVMGKIFTNVIIPVAKKAAELYLPYLGMQIQVVGKAFGLMGKLFTSTWNNVLQPVFKFLANAVSNTLWVLGKLFGALSSIPGAPKWIGKTADALSNASVEVDRLAGKIRKLDGQSATVEVIVRQTYKNVLSGKTDYYGNPTGKATGSSFIPRDDVYRVGEHGSENVWLPRGTRVDNAHQTAAAATAGLTKRDIQEAFERALATLPIVRLPDAGRGAYLRGGI
jgi:hypothetical protein